MPILWHNRNELIVHKCSPKYLAELRGPSSPENAYGESERLAGTSTNAVLGQFPNENFLRLSWFKIDTIQHCLMWS